MPMQRQPRNPMVANMFDPLGLPALPPRNIPRGIFGSSVGSGRGRAAMSPPDPDTPTATYASPSPLPPISQAPPPPPNWQQNLGPELVSRLPQVQAETMDAAADRPQPAPPLGMFGNVARTAPSQLNLSDKTGNRVAPVPQDASARGNKGFDWRMLAGIVGDALLGANGQQPLYALTRIKEHQAQADHARRLAEMAQEWQYRNSQPDYATVGNRRFAYNPATGQAQTLYVAPSEAQDYAAALGAEPGTPEYETLMQDYVLRHSGPTATANAMQEEDNRQGNRLDLEGVRYGNRVNLEGIRQGNRVQLRGLPTYRDKHPRPSSSGSRGGGVREGQTATNPQTGDRVVYRGGKWVPVK